MVDARGGRRALSAALERDCNGNGPRAPVILLRSLALRDTPVELRQDSWAEQLVSAARHRPELHVEGRRCEPKEPFSAGRCRDYVAARCEYAAASMPIGDRRGPVQEISRRVALTSAIAGRTWASFRGAAGAGFVLSGGRRGRFVAQW